MFRLFCLIAFAAFPFVSGCASYSVIKGYEGPDLGDDQAATLRWSPNIGVRSIDVVGPKYPRVFSDVIVSWDEPTWCCKIVKLQPGSYAVDFRAGGSWRYSVRLMFIALPGHEYYVDGQRVAGLQERYYIEDLSACREVVAGFRKDTMWARTLRIVKGCDPEAFEKDPLETFAEIGKPEAQFKIAMRTTQAPDRRRRLLCLAAQQGYAKAAAQLGMIYLLGLDGARQDLVQAYRWYAAADADGHPKTAAALERLENIMTDGQLEEAQRLSEGEAAGTCD